MTGETAPVAERPLLMGANGIFGIIAEPGAGRRRTGVILLNSGILHRVGPSRLYVLLGRRLAELGFVTARIDISGKGDTSRRHNLTSEQSLLQDYDDVCHVLGSRFGIERLIAIGLCSGADDAFTIASARDNLAGLVFLDGYAARTFRYYVRHYGSRALRIGPWLSLARKVWWRMAGSMGNTATHDYDLSMAEIRNFPGRTEANLRFAHIAANCERCLCIYTSASQSYYNYEGQLQHGFPSFRPKAGLREVYLPAARHTFPLAHHRMLVIDGICGWAGDFE
jgi:hypothetical protein